MLNHNILFSQIFIDGYMKIVSAAANIDVKTLKDVSVELGFLTGSWKDTEVVGDIERLMAQTDA